MSRENVELARQYYEAWNAQDVDVMLPLIHPDFEFVDPPNFPDADRRGHGHDAEERVKGFLEVGWDGQCRVQEYLLRDFQSEAARIGSEAVAANP